MWLFEYARRNFIGGLLICRGVLTRKILDQYEHCGSNHLTTCWPRHLEKDFEICDLLATFKTQSIKRKDILFRFYSMST